MPVAHLIHGFVGVGKTTFAKALQQQTKAIRFTLDEWMIELYGTNPPADTFAEREERIVALIWKTAEQAMLAGCDVILDFGFWKRTSRDAAKQRVLGLGAEPRLYSIQCPDDVMQARVLKRTDEMPEGALEINAEAIELFRKRFEPLAPDEAGIVIQTG